MAAFSLSTIAAVRGYPVYKDSWEPSVSDEELEEWRGFRRRINSARIRRKLQRLSQLPKNKNAEKLEDIRYVHEVYTGTEWGVLTIRVGLCTWGIHRDRMRSTYYQGWFMYMRYTQGQNEEYLLSGLVYVHEVYTGTEWGALTIQEYTHYTRYHTYPLSQFYHTAYVCIPFPNHYSWLTCTHYCSPAQNSWLYVCKTSPPFKVFWTQNAPLRGNPAW